MAGNVQQFTFCPLGAVEWDLIMGFNLHFLITNKIDWHSSDIYTLVSSPTKCLFLVFVLFLLCCLIFQNYKNSFYILDTSSLYVLSTVLSVKCLHFNIVKCINLFPLWFVLVMFYFRNPVIALGYNDIFLCYCLKVFTSLFFWFKSLIHLLFCEGVRSGSHSSLIFLLRTCHGAVYTIFI